MADAKRTKRVRDASESLSLEEHIAAKRAALLAARQEAPALRAKAAELRARAGAMTARWQRRPAADLALHAAALEREAEAREGMAREHEFEATVVTYLRSYHQRAEAERAAEPAPRRADTIAAYVRHTDLTGQRHAAILDEYLTEMNQAPPKVAMSARDECPRCAGEKLLLCTAKSCMACPRCGYRVAYLDTSSTSTAFDQTVEYSAYSYKRVNHFGMYLTLVQGKEAHKVPDEILTAVMHDLYHAQGIREPADITQARVRATLRKLRLRKAYDHVTQITARLSGVRAFRLRPEVEDELKNMFLQMQPAFLLHAPKSRTNFLSYPYVLYRLFQILKLDHMLESVALLRGRDKLLANDSIFRKMAATLGWPVADLPPA